MTLAQHAPKLNPPEREEFQFAGFSSPNSTAVPDEFFDVLAPYLSEAELRVLLYIIRRTFGFKKDADTISLKQMVEGIMTRDGRVLDRGAGVAKSTAWRGIKGLVAKGIIEKTRNSSKARGDEATTYALRFRNPVFRYETPPVSQENTPRVSLRNTQKTEEQQTVRQGFEASNGPPIVDKFVDNPGDNFRPTPYLDQVIMDFSREFGDALHAASNRKQARNILATRDLSEERFVEDYVYPARATTRLAMGIDKRMPYFFAVLRDMADENATRVTGAERSG